MSEPTINAYNQALRTRDITQGALAQAEKYVTEPYRRERRPESD